MDLHVHTLYSGHSSPDATVANILVAAAGAQLEVIAVTEHVPTVTADISEWSRTRGDRGVIDAIAEDVEALSPPEDAPRLILGAEIDADPYALDGSLMLEDLAGIEYVLVSSHLFPGGEAFWFESITVPERARRAILDRWVEWMTKVAANPAIDAFAHPGALIGARHIVPEFNDEVLSAMTPMLESMAAYSTAFELNELLGRKLPGPAFESYPRLVKCARALGVRFTVGSDAHMPGAIGGLAWVETLASAAELTPEDFIEAPGSP